MTLPSGNRSKIRGNENCIDLDETKSLNLLKAIWTGVCSCRDSISVLDDGCHASFFFSVIKSLSRHVSLLAIKQSILFSASSMAHEPSSFGRKRKHCPIVLKLQPVCFDSDVDDGDDGVAAAAVVNGEYDDDVDDDGNSLYTSLEIENCVDCSMSANKNIIPLLSLIIFQLFICLRFESEMFKCDFLFSPCNQNSTVLLRFFFHYHLLIPVIMNFILRFWNATLFSTFRESLDHFVTYAAKMPIQLPLIGMQINL